MSAGTAQLREILAAEGGALAEALEGAAPVGHETPDHAADWSAGDADVALAVRAVLEGSRLHYATSPALPIDDPDLALLAGDRLYALGLARLAEIGAMDAIAALADVIAMTAQAHAQDEPAMAAEAWTNGAKRVRARPDGVS